MTATRAPSQLVRSNQYRDQRYYVTIVKSDLCNSTGIAAKMDPEIYGELLGQLRTSAEQVIAHHGGEIVRIDGDGMICIFGYPVPHEHAGRHATAAALDLHQAATMIEIADLAGARLRLHTGIHSGLVLLRTGDIVRGRFEMLGDPTNLAARLCDAAAPGEILVSASTLGTDRHFFDTAPERLIAVRGRDKLLRALPVTAHAPVETRFDARQRSGFAPFVGREQQLALLLDHLDACIAGALRLVSLVGRPGIGKTRLLGEFTERAARRGAAVYRGYCESYSGALPLQPMVQLVRGMLAGYGEGGVEALPIVDAARRDLLARLLRLDRDGGMADAHLLRPELVAPAVLDLLGCEGDPVLLLIDDWQWADDASRQLLDRVLAGAGARLMVVLATRAVDSELEQMHQVETVALAPLSDPESTEMIHQLIAAPEPFLVDRLAARAGGDPLVIEELCHAFTGDRGAASEQDREIWLDLLIQARFALLPPRHAEVVRRAAVIGHIIPEWLFEQVVEIPPDDRVARELMDEDFLYRGELPGTLRFKHGITRDAIYATVSIEERRVLHGRVIEALRARSESSGDDGQLDALAYHHAAAGDFTRARLLAVQAGNRAKQACALDRAQAHYRAALDSIDRLGDAVDRRERMDVLCKFGLACVVDPADEHLPVLQESSARACADGDEEALAWSEYWLGFVLYGLGRGLRSITHLKTALAAAETIGDANLAVQVRANLGQSFAVATDYARALALLDEAIEANCMRRTGHAYSLSCRAFLHADQGRFAEADVDFDAAIGTLEGVEHEMMASVLSHRAAARLWQGRLDDAEHFAVEAHRVATHARARYLFAMTRALQAQARWLRDGDSEQLVQLARETRWLDGSKSQQYLSLNHGWLAEGLAETGDIAGARHHAARAFLRARQGDRLGEAMAARALARLAAAGHGRRAPEYYLAIAQRSAAGRGSAHEAARNLLCVAQLTGSDGARAAVRESFAAAALTPSRLELAALTALEA